MDDANLRRISVDLPLSFQCWLGQRAKKNGRVKLAEMKMMCTALPARGSLFNMTSWYNSLPHLQTRIEEEVGRKWMTIPLPLSFHLWLKNLADDSRISKADALKLLCLWMQDNLN